MLGKLLKHEWNATARKYGLFYLILAAVTLFTAIIHALPVDNVFFSMSEVALIVIYVISLIGIFLCSTGMAVVRFYKNMVSDEGYLTFTLPAKVEQLVFSKLVVAFVWQLVTIVLCVVSLLCVFVLGHIEFGEVFGIFAEVLDGLDGVVALLTVMMLISIVYQFLFYYLSIAIGQLFGNYKILASVLSYCALSVVIELIITAIMLGVFGLTGFVEMSQSTSVLEGMNGLYSLMIGLMATVGVAAYFVTCHLLKKKLNLV